jgi:hypothetical protein
MSASDCVRLGVVSFAIYVIAGLALQFAIARHAPRGLAGFAAFRRSSYDSIGQKLFPWVIAWAVGLPLFLVAFALFLVAFCQPAVRG